MPFVEPPVPVTPTIAFSSDSRVTSADGRTSRSIRPSTSAPAASAASPLAGSAAGTLPSPIGPSPRKSIATDIVFAVKWPAQAP